MLTYRLQQRVFRLKDQGDVSFPADVVLNVILAPAGAFGESPVLGEGGSRTALRCAKIELFFDANTGRGGVRTQGSPQRVTAVVGFGAFTGRLDGAGLTLHGRCQTLTELTGIVRDIYDSLPLLLNVYFADPPSVLAVRGSVNSVRFGWEFAGDQVPFRLTDAASQLTELNHCLGLIALVNSSESQRLAAGLHYFHVACRLAAAGVSRWEFMAETILNLAKALQALFGDRRDEVRAELLKLEYTEPEIEKSSSPSWLCVTSLMLATFFSPTWTRLICACYMAISTMSNRRFGISLRN